MPKNDVMVKLETSAVRDGQSTKVRIFVDGIATISFTINRKQKGDLTELVFCGSGRMEVLGTIELSGMMRDENGYLSKLT